jgi:hypothetical protein
MPEFEVMRKGVREGHLDGPPKSPIFRSIYVVKWRRYLDGEAIQRIDQIQNFQAAHS